MSKNPLVPKSEIKSKKLKTDLSSEVGMEFIDEIYKGRKSSKTIRYLGRNIGGLFIKNVSDIFGKNLIDK